METKDKSRSKSSIFSKWLWIIILLCVLGGAVTGLWFFMKGDAEHVEHLEQVGADPNWP